MKHVLNTKELHRLSKASMRLGLSKLQWGNGGKKGQVIKLFNHSKEVRFASLLSGGFITAIVTNPPEIGKTHLCALLMFVTVN